MVIQEMPDKIAVVIVRLAASSGKIGAESREEAITLLLCSNRDLAAQHIRLMTTRISKFKQCGNPSLAHNCNSISQGTVLVNSVRNDSDLEC